MLSKSITARNIVAKRVSRDINTMIKYLFAVSKKEGSLQNKIFAVIKATSRVLKIGNIKRIFCKYIVCYLKQQYVHTIKSDVAMTQIYIITK